MSEIHTPVIELEEGTTHLCEDGDFLITDNHSLADVVRWLIEQSGGEPNDIMWIVKDQIIPLQQEH